MGGGGQLPWWPRGHPRSPHPGGPWDTGWGDPEQAGGEGGAAGRGHPLGTPDTSRRGRSTRKALRAFTSRPAPLLLMGAVLLWMTLTCSRITVKTLQVAERGPAAR